MVDLRFVLVDDESIQRDQMQQLIQQIAVNNDFLYSLMTFSSGEAFLFALEDGLSFDLCFLDIQMKELDGLQVAAILRHRQISSPIIFTTAFSEYAIHGYEVQAFDYLLKPITKERLERVFERYLHQHPVQEREVLLESSGEKIRLSEKDVLYLEAQLHQTRVVTNEREYLVSLSFKKVCLLFSSDFIAIHRSYFVNLRAIQQLSKQEVLLQSQERLPISRRLVKTVQEAFVDFYKKEAFYE